MTNSPGDGIKSYFKANPGKATVIVFGAIFGLVGLAAFLLPDIVWDQFLWKYYWGPIAADAEDRTIDGIGEGYNAISTITYGIILAAAIFVIYRIIVVLNIKLDKWFFVAVIPFILFGGFARALEDAMFFKSPAVYIFIAPVIYVFTGLTALTCLVVSHLFSKKSKDLLNNKKFVSNSIFNNRRIIYDLYILTFIPIILIMNYMIVFWSEHMIFYPSTIIIAAITSLIIIGYSTRNANEKIHMPFLLGGYGIVLLSFPATAVVEWFHKPADWMNTYMDVSGETEIVLRPIVLVTIIGLSILATVIWAGAAHFIQLKTRWNEAALFGSGINLALVFGQFTDAAATFIAIDRYNYWEKHVLPSFLIGVTESAAVMFLLKTLALFFAIYVLDIYLKDELKDHKQIIPLVKLAVLVLGLAPGTRDMLRLAMGV